MNYNPNASKTIALTKLLRAQPLYRDVFDVHLMLGTNDEISIDDAIAYSHEERPQVIDFFKKCDSEGIGKYWIGRRSQPTRLKLLISKKALKEAIKASKGMPGMPIGEFEKPKQLIVNDKLDRVTHQHLLRAGDKITIELPSDFNRKDAQRLKSWIDTIPF